MESEPRRPMNAGFKVGLTGVLLMACINLLVFLLNGDSRGDFWVWLFQLVVYYVLGRLASARQAELQRHTYEPGRGVSGAGIGAALITSIGMWIYIILRDVIRSALGAVVFFWPLLFCGWVIIDVLLALGIGSLAAYPIAREHPPTEV